MDNFSLMAVSPIDGRYASKAAPLREYFSGEPEYLTVSLPTCCGE